MPFHFGTVFYFLTRELYTKRYGKEHRGKKNKLGEEKIRSFVVVHYSNYDERGIREKKRGSKKRG